MEDFLSDPSDYFLSKKDFKMVKRLRMLYKKAGKKVYLFEAHLDRLGKGNVLGVFPTLGPLALRVLS